MGSAKVEEQSLNLTRFSPGSIKELSTIAWPLVLSFLSASLMNFFNRFFLSHYSLEALEAAVCAMNLAFLFQIPCMRITSVAQIFIARYAGSRELSKIGSVVWQMIWLSLFTMAITLPLGLGAGYYFFKGTSIKAIGTPFFDCLMFSNFLFPLSGALTAFFTGLGRTRVIIIVLAAVHLVQIWLDWMLIFGVPGIISPQGAFGAALSTVFAQSLYCMILAVLFLRKKEWTIFGTGNWRLRMEQIKEYIAVGLPRALAKLVILAAWASCVAIFTHRGGDYLLTFSIGASLYAFFSCLNEGLGQALITVASYYLGKAKQEYIPQIAQSALLMLGGILSFVAIFFLLFPQLLVTFFFPQILSSEQLSMLTRSCYGLWFFFLGDGLSWIGFGFLSAFKEMKFYFIYTLITAGLFNYLPIHLAYSAGSFPADNLWWIISIPCFASALAYLFRIFNRLRSTEALRLKNETNL